MSHNLFLLRTKIEREVTRARLDALQSDWPVSLIPQAPEASSLETILESFPSYFQDAFPPIDPEPLRTLTLAIRLLSSSLLVADAVMDGDGKPEEIPSRILRCEAMQFEAWRCLGAILPPDSVFWPRCRGLMAEYARACLLERDFVDGRRAWEEFSEPFARALAIGKNSPVRIPVAALAALSGDEEPYGTLPASLDEYSVALQMYDDVRDWKRDLVRGFPSLLLVKALGERPDADRLASADFLREAAREIYYGGHCRFVLLLALEALDRADRLAARFGELGWRSMLDFLRGQCATLLKDFERIVQRNLERIAAQPDFLWARPTAASPWQEVAWDALDFVIAQWRLGFGEARHIIDHGTDLFQRAIIAEIFCGAVEIAGEGLRPFLNHEAAYLVSCRSAPPVGGWSYFPDRPEEPPDADDLGQVMQVLLRTGRRRDVVEPAESALAVLFRDNAYEDGSFDTWIIPAVGRTPLHELQATNAAKFRGDRTGEVVANLLYALVLYDPKRFDDRIRRGVSFLETHQDAEGSWSSFWYVGPFYGTYVCLRLLAVAAPGSPAVARGVDFLRRAEREDGGWGIGEASDPLSTSLALLGLALGAGREALEPARVEKALSFLRAGRQEDGGWAAVPFITMPQLEHNPTYASRTLTTAYVLKACLVWDRLLQPSGRETA